MLINYIDRLWGIYLVTENKTQIDDLVHFTLREWSRLSYNVTEAETERAKAQLKASILLSLDGTTAVAEDIGRQIVTTGRRMNPEEVERVIGAISEKDVMDFARRKLWDQDVAVSAVGSIEGYVIVHVFVLSFALYADCLKFTGLQQDKKRHVEKRLDGCHWAKVSWREARYADRVASLLGEVGIVNLLEEDRISRQPFTSYVLAVY